MPTLLEVRAKFPQYNDMSDSDLAESLHSKYYADMPFGEFAGKIGYRRDISTIPGDAKRSAGGNALEMAQGLGHAVMNPSETIKGIGGLAAGGIDNLVGMGLDAVGVDRGTPSPEQTERRGAASSTGHELVDTLGTREGFLHYLARKPVSAGTDVATLLTGGASLVPRLAGRVPGVTLKEMLRNAPTRGTVAKQTTDMFDAIKAKDVQLSPDNFIQHRDALGSFLKDEGITPFDAPRSTAQFDRMNDILPPHKQPTPSGNWYDNPPAPVADARTLPLNEVESIRRGAGRVERGSSLTVSDTDKMVAGKVKKTIDDIYKQSGNPEIAKEMEAAREMGRRNILSKQIREMARKGEEYRSGAESGLGNQFNNYLKSEKGKGLSAEEKAAFRKVSRREGMAGITSALGGRLGLIAAASLGGPAGVAVSLTARKIMEALTRGAVSKAEKTVLIGQKAAKEGAQATRQQMLDRIVKALLAAQASQKTAGAHR